MSEYINRRNVHIFYENTELVGVAVPELSLHNLLFTYMAAFHSLTSGASLRILSVDVTLFYEIRLKVKLRLTTVVYVMGR